MIVNLIFYAIAFIGIWFGAGFIISSTSKFSQRLRISPFAFSFVFLGLLTSTPEFSVGLQSISHNNPAIFVGNLLGGILVLFLVDMPLLAILGKRVSLKHEMDKKTLLATLAVIISPALLVLDQRVTYIEGILLIVLYLILLVLVEKNNGIFDKENKQLLNAKAYSYKDFLKILIGLGIVFVSSNVIVDQTVFFADYFHISAYFISLFVVAIGTDLPELTLAARSVLSGNKEIAMGDYIGAAAASTFLFGIFTVLNQGEVLTTSNFWITFVFIGAAMIIFYLLSTTQKYISRNHGIGLLILYLLFVVVELM